MSHPTGLLKAKRHYRSQKALAKALDRPRQTITNWINRDKKIPNLFDVFKIFSKLKGSIHLDELTENSEEILQLIDEVKLYHKYPAIELPINEIQIIRNCPFYKEAAQVFYHPHHDLSLPILIDNNNQLITCECRLRASKASMQKKVFVHRIDLVKLIDQTLYISELLDLLPISEKVAIGLAIEKTLGNRQGKKTKHPVNYPEVKHCLETREIAAKNTGIGSESLYRKAKFVITNGIAALIQAMDEKLLKISKAEEIAKLSTEEQTKYMSALQKNQKLTPNRRKQ